MNTDLINRLERIEAMLSAMPDVEIVESIARIESKIDVLIDALAGEDDAPEEIVDLDGMSHIINDVKSESLD
jgi:hypothetical protein